MRKLILTSKQVEKALNIRANTLHYYIKAGALVPEIDAGKGRGKKRLFSETNLMEIFIIKRLIDYGIPQRVIVALLKAIRKNGERERLNNECFSEDFDEYLLLYGQPIVDGQLYYRFILDGGPKYRYKRKEFKEVVKKTSMDRPEYLGDFLLMIDTSVVINLKAAWRKILGNALIFGGAVL